MRERRNDEEANLRAEIEDQEIKIGMSLLKLAITSGIAPIKFAADIVKMFGNTGMKIARSLFPAENEQFFEDLKKED